MTSNIATDLVLFTDTCILLKNVTSDNIQIFQYRSKIISIVKKLRFFREN